MTNQQTACHLPLTFRELKPCDIAAAAALLGTVSEEHHDPRLILQVWPQLLANGCLSGVLIEDANGALVSLGASVFVNPSFVQRLQSGSEQYLAARITRTALSNRSPVCSPGGVGAANAGAGLSVFVLHSGLASVGACPVSAVMTQLMLGFVQRYVGYNIQQILVEAFGDEERSMYVDGSAFRVVAILGGPCAQRSQPDSIRTRRSYLLALTRRDASDLPIHSLLPIFGGSAVPRCSFSSTEQAVLVRALDGCTDKELAQELGVGLSTIKKRWNCIFDRVERCLPTLLPLSTLGHRLGRGVQKRHLILRYARAHPEELRPYCAPDATVINRSAPS